MMTLIIIAIILAITSSENVVNVIGMSTPTPAPADPETRGFIEAAAASTGRPASIHSGMFRIPLQFFGAPKRPMGFIAQALTAKAEPTVALPGAVDPEKVTAATKAVSDLVGYKVDLPKQAAYKSSNTEKAEWLLGYGRESQRQAARDFLLEQEEIAAIAGGETIAEINAAAAAAGIEKEFAFFSEGSKLPYAAALLEAAYVKAVAAGRKDLAAEAYEAATAEAKAAGLILDEEVRRVALGELSAENLVPKIKSWWTIKISRSSGKTQKISLNKAVIAHQDEFVLWINGFKTGYKTVIPGRYGDLEAIRPQTAAEAQELSLVRATGLANIIAGRLVETCDDEKGNLFIKRGVRKVDTDTALIGFFGDPTGEFAVESAKRAGAMSSMLDISLACGSTLRDILAIVKEQRNDRAALRANARAELRELSGASSTEFELGRAYQSAVDEIYCGDPAELAEVSGYFDEEQFVKEIEKITDKRSYMIWDFAQIIKGGERIRRIEEELASELGIERSKATSLFEAWAAFKVPALFDMFIAQKELREALQYEHTAGDEVGLTETICKAFSLAEDYAGNGGSAWTKMFAGCGGYFDFYEIFDALQTNENKLFQLVEGVLLKDARPTKGLVKALCEHKIPGLWRECAPADELSSGAGYFVDDERDLSKKGFIIEGGTAELEYGCSRYAEARKAITDTILSNENMVVWYGQTIVNLAGEYAPEVNLECIRAWMEGLENGQKPWESYPKAGLIPGNPEFNRAAIARFGTATDVITMAEVEALDKYLKDTVLTKDGGSKYLRGILNFSWGDTQENVEKARRIEKEIANG